MVAMLSYTIGIIFSLSRFTAWIRNVILVTTRGVMHGTQPCRSVLCSPVNNPILRPPISYTMHGGPVGTRGRSSHAVGWVLAALLLAGCSDRLLDTGASLAYFADSSSSAATASPTTAVTAPPQPSPIRRIADNDSSQDTSWPNLSSVPQRPIDIPSLRKRTRTLDDLARERALNQDSAAALRAIPSPPDLGTIASPPAAERGTPLPKGKAVVIQ